MHLCQLINIDAENVCVCICDTDGINKKKEKNKEKKKGVFVCLYAKLVDLFSWRSSSVID
jgi:hypothetical protein